MSCGSARQIFLFLFRFFFFHRMCMSCLSYPVWWHGALSTLLAYSIIKNVHCCSLRCSFVTTSVELVPLYVDWGIGMDTGCAECRRVERRWRKTQTRSIKQTSSIKGGTVFIMSRPSHRRIEYRYSTCMIWWSSWWCECDRHLWPCNVVITRQQDGPEDNDKNSLTLFDLLAGFATLSPHHHPHFYNTW